MNKVLKLGALLVVLTVVLSLTALSQVYVSATNGDDTFGAGTLASPYRTIQKAINVAPTGSTISVEAGIYNSTLLTGEGNPISLTTAKSLTFVGTIVGVNTTVELTAGFTLNNASAVVDFGSTGTAKFNFGTTASALVLTAGSMTSSVPANVVLGSGATITLTAGTLSFIPTTGTNVSVTFNGTTAVNSTAAYMPSSFGSGTLTINQATGAVTVDNSSLTLTQLVHSGAANATINSDVTVKDGGDITNSSTGTLTIGSSAANTLTMTTTEATSTAVITVSGGGSVVVNSAIVYNVANTKPAGVDGTSLTVGNVIALTGASNFTANGNITFNNTNAATTVATIGVNAVKHNVTISNAGSGALSIVGSISTPLSSVVFSAPTGGVNNAFIDVKLSNTGSGSFSTRSAATRGATGTNGVINTGGGTMTIGQAGDTFTTAYDVQNGSAANTEVLTINAGGTFTGTFTNNGGAAVLTVFGANSSISGTVTNAGKIKLNANTLTLSKTGAAALANTGDIYSVTTATIGSGLVKFTGAAPANTGGGNLPNVEYANSGAGSTAAGSIYYGNLTKSGAGDLTIGGTSDIKGNLNMTGAGLVTFNDAGNVSSMVRGNLTMTAGNITLGTAGLTVYGTFTMPQGTFTFGSRTLDLKGDFNRTGGTINAAAAGTGTLNFSGTVSQTFTPGTQMNVYNVTVNNTGTYVANVVADDKVTVNASLIVLNNFTITTGNVVLGTSNIRMQQTGGISARFTNGGRGYTATGVGGLIFEGAGTNTGAAGDGAVITGAQPYSNIFIRLTTPANNVMVLGAVKISGVVTFDGGGLSWNTADEGGDLFTAGTLTLDDALAVPTVVINTANTHGSPYMVDGADGGAVALAITSVYNLSYTGQTNTTMTATDFVSNTVNNLSIIAGTSGKTIQFIAGAGTIKGVLSIDNGETLNLTNGAARTLTASSNTAAHVVNGTISGGTFEITGTGASLTGGSGTGNASSVSALVVDPATAGTFTSTGMKVLTALTLNHASLVSTITMNSATATVGAFTNTAGTTTLNMNSTVSGISGNFLVTAGAVTLTMNGGAAGTRTIAGALDVNGGSLTLGSHIDVTGAVGQTLTGAIVMGDYNLTLANTYTHSGTGTISAGTGQFIAAAGATRIYTFTTAVNIPNFTLNSPGFGIQFATNGLTVTGKFVHTAGDLDLNSKPLTLSGTSYKHTAGTYTNTGLATTGLVSFTGAAMTIDGVGSPTMPYVKVNSTGTLTFVADNETTPGTPIARSLTVTGAFTHTAGAIALDINDIVLTAIGGADANYTRAAGSFTAATSGADLGELTFGGANNNHTFTPGVGLVIPNIKFTSGTTLGGTDAFTVANNVTLGATFTVAATKLVLSDGVTITRSAGTFTNEPVFGTTLNVYYSGAVTTGVELPTSATVLNNLTIDAAVTLNAATTVNGKLLLKSGAFTTTSPKIITMAAGATLVKTGAASITAPVVPTGALNLEYSGATATDANTWPSAATIGSLKFSAAGTKTLHAARTSQGAVNFAGGSFDINAFNFTVQGDVTFSGGALINGGAVKELIFSGSTDQTLTLAADYDLPASINLRLNKGTTTAKVSVVGGNLNFNTNIRTLYLDKGVMTIAAGKGFILAKPTTTTLYVIRTLGMLAGAVRYPITAGDGAAGTNGRFEFPTGTTTGLYRPVAITFTPSYAAQNPTNLEVTQVDATPAGTVGFPVDGGNSIKIGGYPSYYWLVKATPSSFSATQQFDVELTGTNLGVPFDNVSNLRIVRRIDGSATTNPWQLQGAGSSYTNNFLNVIGADSIITVRATSSSGGIVVEGTRFTIGVPTRAPVFTVAPATASVNENAALSVQFTADPQDVGETIVYGLTGGPTPGPTISATGLVTWTPTYAQAGVYNVTVTANDGQYSTSTPLAITVNNVNRAPVMTAVANQTTTDGAALSVALASTDADGDARTYSIISTTPAPSVAPVVSGSNFTWTPGFADAGIVYTVWVKVSDGVSTGAGPTPGVDSTSFTVTVNYSRVLGDVDGNGSVQAPDAAMVLSHVAGITPITGAAALYAADATKNGSISAFDAAYILYYASFNSFPSSSSANSLAKGIDAAGTLSWNSPAGTNEADIVKIGLDLSNAANVYAVQLSSKVDANLLSIDGVNASLPDGWDMKWNVVNGELRVAMAGATPLPSGSVATVMVRLMNRESRLSFSADAMLNEAVQSLGAVEIAAVPTVFALAQNYPNPFNPSTTIKYQIANDANVNLDVYNLQGQKIRTLVAKEQKAGYYSVVWDGRTEAGQTVSSGLYLYRVQAGSFVATHKMLMIK